MKLALTNREILEQSGQLNNWHGDPNPKYESASTVSSSTPSKKESGLELNTILMLVVLGVAIAALVVGLMNMRKAQKAN